MQNNLKLAFVENALGFSRKEDVFGLDEWGVCDLNDARFQRVTAAESFLFPDSTADLLDTTLVKAQSDAK